MAEAQQGAPGSIIAASFTASLVSPRRRQSPAKSSGAASELGRRRGSISCPHERVRVRVRVRAAAEPIIRGLRVPGEAAVSAMAKPKKSSWLGSSLSRCGARRLLHSGGRCEGIIIMF